MNIIAVTEARFSNTTCIIDSIVDEEPYGRRPLLFIGIVKQVLNTLNVADVSLGKDHHLIIFRLIWHFWNHMDEPHRARYFSIFQSLLNAPGKSASICKICHGRRP
ncbi:hypothetical protein T12_9150 [Trichinella patagoniensis]|uniref:Uncharacterized protein n=1 Tax=Trichinella patagoniensis TaxID=990121 RepID=A0A0V0ZDD4_9BILA|nr:hypothetical protein T12_9150 [Trichinella patagoniensis]